METRHTVIGQTFSTRLDAGSDLEDRRPRSEFARLVPWYGLFAVVVVSLIQLFFSFEKGGYFIYQWYWGASAIAIALIGAALVPGYLSRSSLGRWQ